MSCMVTPHAGNFGARLTGPISIDGVSSEDRDADQGENCRCCLDHCRASCLPIEARYRLHDCIQIRSNMNCI